MNEPDRIVVMRSNTGTAELTVRDLNIEAIKSGYRRCVYHYVITRSGEVQKGREESEPGMYPNGANSIGVLLVGDDENLTEAQPRALHSLLAELLARYPKAQLQAVL